MCSRGRTLESSDGAEKASVHGRERLALTVKSDILFYVWILRTLFSFLPTLLPTVTIMAPSEKLTYLFES